MRALVLIVAVAACDEPRLPDEARWVVETPGLIWMEASGDDLLALESTRDGKRLTRFVGESGERLWSTRVGSNFIPRFGTDDAGAPILWVELPPLPAQQIEVMWFHPETGALVRSLVLDAPHRVADVRAGLV